MGRTRLTGGHAGPAHPSRLGAYSCLPRGGETHSIIFTRRLQLENDLGLGAGYSPSKQLRHRIQAKVSCTPICITVNSFAVMHLGLEFDRATFVSLGF